MRFFLVVIQVLCGLLLLGFVWIETLLNTGSIGAIYYFQSLVVIFKQKKKKKKSILWLVLIMESNKGIQPNFLVSGCTFHHFSLSQGKQLCLVDPSS